MAYPGGGATDPGNDPGRDLSPEARGCLGLVVLVCALVMIGLTASLWGDMPGLLRAAFVTADAAALGLGIYGLLHSDR